MIKGIVERRTACRIPFKTALQIKLSTPANPGGFSAYSVDISAGGIKFTTSIETPIISVGERLELLFQIPNLGSTILKGEITYRTTQNGLLAYGVKFIEMNHDTWKAVLDYCYGPDQAKFFNAATPPPTVETPKSLTISNKIIPAKNNMLKTILYLHNDTEILVDLEDISFGGTRINLCQSLAIDLPVNLRIKHSDMELTLNGICVWSSLEPDGTYAAGIFFHSLTDREFQELKALINRLSENMDV